ncbi:MAG: glycosyltransferase [Candidatus Nezhaarchaeales archaeon]
MNVTEDRGLQLSVVVPTYNEVENIVELIERVESALRGARFEVIIVDDGSPDGTADVAESLNEKHDNVVVLREDW